MTIINTSPDRPIQLGYEGEDRVTVLRFRYGKDWIENGEGVFHIRVRRHGEHTAYNAALVADDAENNCLLMTVTNVELSVKGSGEMQVVYSGEDFVKKSPIYSYNVSRAVDEVADPPAQDVYTQIIESLSGLHDTVWDIDRAVAETDARVGNLADLTTHAKTDLVSAINEVNEHGGGGSVTVDDALSDVSTNPVQNRAITEQIDFLTGDVQGLQTAVQGKADTATVSALADAVQDLYGDVQDLQTGLAGKVEIPHTDEAKIAIQKMLGIYEAPWELINEETFTNETEADYVITTDANGNAFELTDLIILFETPKQATRAAKGYFGHIWCYYGNRDSQYMSLECGVWGQNANESYHACGGMIENKGGLMVSTIIQSSIGGTRTSVCQRLITGFSQESPMSFIPSSLIFTKINIRAVTGTGHYRLYGKRKWT